jgi:hypothetical protein
MRVSPLLALTALTASAKSINPAVKRIVDAVSEERMAAIEKKLESFETRNVFSDPDHPTARNRRRPLLVGKRYGLVSNRAPRFR